MKNGKTKQNRNSKTKTKTYRVTEWSFQGGVFPANHLAMVLINKLTTVKINTRNPNN